jgi:hypothetical protein
MKPLIYVASPYTKGDAAINTNFQCRIWDQLMDDGRVWPYVPLWSHFQHALFPRPYTDWIEYDNAVIPRMDACLRLNAVCESVNYEVSESSGADNEVKLFESLGKPVFYSIEDLYEWVESKESVLCQ